MSGSTPDEHGADRATSSPSQPPASRNAIAGAAELLGGAAALAAWAQADEKNAEKFWLTLYPKLLATHDASDPGGKIDIGAAIQAARMRVVAAKAAAGDTDGDAA